MLPNLQSDDDDQTWLLAFSFRTGKCRACNSLYFCSSYFNLQPAGKELEIVAFLPFVRVDLARVFGFLGTTPLPHSKDYCYVNLMYNRAAMLYKVCHCS